MATAVAKKPSTSAMDMFVWEGTDKRGVKIKGEQVAKNPNLLKAELRRQGINPTKVAKKGKPLFGSAGRSISPRDIAIFSRQIATMMSAGVPLVQAFDIITQGQENPRMKQMLVDIKNDIEGGSTLHEALGKFPVQFDELYLNLVKAGESAGVLDTILDTIATYKENIEALKGKVKKAMYYPAAILFVAFIVSVILLIYVVPQFQDVFRGFGADLPAFTQFVINISEFVQAYWWIIFGVLIAAGFGFIQGIRRSRNFARTVDRLMLKVPVIGQILNQSAIARFARTLAITFKAGVPLVEALETVGGATGSIVYAEAVAKIREDVAVGHQLQLAMKQTGVFPTMVVQMTAIGEESGALDTMLIKVAEFYEQEVNNAVDALSSLLEPFIMVIIGVLVGGLVIAMYLPIFKLASVI